MNTGHPLRCVVFDFDGTLVDSNGLKREAWFTVFGALGCSRTEISQLLEQNPASDRFELITLLLTGRGAGEAEPERVAALALQYNELCESGQATCTEIPGAAVMLVCLAQTVPLYLNSATPEEPLKRIVARRGWAGYFRGVFGRPAGKLEILKRIAEREQLAPNEIAMVGDGVADRLAAEQMGCVFFGVGELAATPLAYGRQIARLTDLPALLSN